MSGYDLMVLLSKMAEAWNERLTNNRFNSFQPTIETKCGDLM